jgi:hypothetical protein
MAPNFPDYCYYQIIYEPCMTEEEEEEEEEALGETIFIIIIKDICIALILV